MKNPFSKHIKLLPEELCNQIAAGEVVERPASVMKELVENSLDAKASNIVVRVENGGQSLIVVEDNGEGIAKEELELALTRHATSKLLSIADLSNISSYGFRGEALPSIASVSKFKICSKTAEAENGSELQVNFGKINEISPCSFQNGTMIEVKDLFLNIPARLKFLKSPSTELKKLTELFIRLALIADKVNLSLYAGERLSHTFLAEDDLKTRLEKIWPPTITDALLPVNYKNKFIEIKGFVSNPQSCQPRADKMWFYVNGRAINDKILLKSVRQAFQGKLTSRDYPQCVLCIELDPQEIDVNVHPAKNEIRFRDEQLIFGSMQKAIDFALENNTTYFSAKNLHIEQETNSKILNSQHKIEQNYEYSPKPQGFWGNAEKDQSLSFVKQASKKSDDFSSEMWQAKPLASSLENINQLQEQESVMPQLSHQEQNVTETSNMMEQEEYLTPPNGALPEGLTYLGQIAKTYLLLKQKDEALILLDQHAVHERILYEKISKGIVQSQQLLLPLNLPLHPSEVKTLEEGLPKLQKLGFGLQIKANSCQVNTVPNPLDRQGAKEFLQEILAEKNSDLEKIWIKLACSKALKANTELGMQEAIKLIQQWLSTDEPDFCPHGRPCVLHFDANNLELMFKRKA